MEACNSNVDELNFDNNDFCDVDQCETEKDISLEQSLISNQIPMGDNKKTNVQVNDLNGLNNDQLKTLHISDVYKKTVSFSSTPLEQSRKITNAADCLNYMQQGSELLKVRSTGRSYKRFFFLDMEKYEMRWNPSSKKKNKAKISYLEMKEIRVGKHTDTLRYSEIAGQYPEECAFSIIYGDDFHSLDLIATSPDEAKIWLTGLTCLLAMRSHAGNEVLEDRQQIRERWLADVFSNAEPDDEGFLSDIDVISLMKKLNSGVATVRIRQKLKEVEMARRTNNRGRLSSDDFVNLFKEISTRPEIYFLLVRHSSNGDYMTTDDLLLFLEAEQGIKRVTKDACFKIIQRFEPSPEGQEKGQLGIDGFTAFLLSEECSIFDAQHKHVCQDMSQPLSHYFINSSHKTYLLEDQLKGPSSVEGYIYALCSGSRFIDVDCWDGAQEEPIVYHGHTLTSKILFRNVVETINDYAFVASEYPLILNIENHCSVKQQIKMASIMREVFGSKLFLDEVVDVHAEYLPSLNFFKNKILIRGKKLPTESVSGNEAVVVAGYVSEEDENGLVRSKDKLAKGSKGDSTKKMRLARDLSDMVNYCESRRFCGADLSKALTTQCAHHVCSLSESVSLKLSTSEDFVFFNKRFLTRVYPNYMRVDSSNYNPQDFWNAGCQIVALNFQTHGIMMDLNRGFFLKNGGSGYVLKPAVMREPISYFSLHTKEGIPDVLPQTLHLRIISGHQLPKPKGSAAKGDVIDPYVVVEVFGIPADCAEDRTKTVPSNGHSPVFDKTFEFEVSLPQLALVRFVVLDDDYIGDEFIGQYTIPFECIQTGYRQIHLLNYAGHAISNAYLIVHVAITDKQSGPKTGRRHLSSKQMKKLRDYPSLKNVGFKQIDETFKNAMSVLREATDLRAGVQLALVCFRETCGLAPICNMKQCIRLLAARAASSSCCNAAQDSPPLLQMTCPNGQPHLEFRSHLSNVSNGNNNCSCLPDAIRKSLQAFEQLMAECRLFLNNVDRVHKQLEDCQRSGMEFYEDLPRLCQAASFKSRRTSRSTEAFSWNIRVFKGQADLLHGLKQETRNYMRQAVEVALSTGLADADLVEVPFQSAAATVGSALSADVRAAAADAGAPAADDTE